MSDQPARDWWRDFFDEAYRSVSAPILSAERTARDVNGVCRLVSEHLGLATEGRRARVLDVCGGDGRVAGPLVAAGYETSVLDVSTTMLKAGGEACREVEFVRGDARAVPFDRNTFDVALNLFNSFGYFDDDAEHVLMLREMERCLRPGGLIILEIGHRDHFVRTLAQPLPWHPLDDGLPVWRHRVFDPVAGVSDERMFFTDDKGTISERAWRCRIFTATEIARMLREAGLEALAWYGGLDLSPFSTDATELVVVARKALAASPQYSAR